MVNAFHDVLSAHVAKLALVTKWSTSAPGRYMFAPGRTALCGHQLGLIRLRCSFPKADIDWGRSIAGWERAFSARFAETGQLVSGALSSTMIGRWSLGRSSRASPEPVSWAS